MYIHKSVFIYSPCFSFNNLNPSMKASFILNLCLAHHDLKSALLASSMDNVISTTLLLALFSLFAF